MADVDVLEEVAMKHQLIRVSGIFCLLLLAATATAGTWSASKFFYQPALGARGATEKDNFDTGLNRVDAHLSHYKTLGDPNYSTLSEALATIGSSHITLTIPAGSVSITSNTTIPANIDLRILEGAKFDVATGVTLTINGPIEAGPYQIFSWAGTGALNLKDSPTKRCFFQWWGAQAEAYWSSFDSYNNSAVLAKAFASLGPNQEIYVTKGIWRCTSTVSVMDSNPPSLVGQSTRQATLYFDVGTSNDGLVIGHYSDYPIYGCWLRNISFAAPDDGCRHLLNLQNWNNYGGTERVDVQGGSTDYIVNLSVVENCNWDFTIGTNNGWYSNNVGLGNDVGRNKWGIYLGPNEVGGSYGSGTYNTFRVLQTFSYCGSRAFYAESSYDFEIRDGDIENCYGGDGPTWMGGSWPYNEVKPLYSGGDTKMGQTFTLTSETTIRNAKLMFNFTGYPTGWITASIYATSGGAPTGSPLITSPTKYASNEVNGGNPFSYVFDFNTTLSAGTYFICGEYSGGDASNYVGINVDTVSGGAGTGNCYSYNGSWQAQNTWDLRYALNVNPAVELYKCSGVKIKHQHFEGNALDLKVDQSSDIDLENIFGGIEIARSHNITLGGSSSTNRYLQIDPMSSVALENNYLFPSSIALEDFGNTIYQGHLRDWNSRAPVNMKGNNLLNQAGNYWLDRWQSSPTHPDRWGDNHDSGLTWTKCGTGQSDTTRHQAPYCAKLVTSGSDNWVYYTISDLLDAVKGNWITISLWVNFPTGQTIDHYTYTQISTSVPSRADSTAYQVGDGINTGSGIFICVQAGTTAASAPDFSSTGTDEYIMDGTVRWIKWGLSGNISGGNISNWNDGVWRRVSMTQWIPKNCTSLAFIFRINGSGKTVYIAEPTINFGSIPSRGLQSAGNEFQNHLQVGGNRLDWGSNPPSDGRWCNQGDVRFNLNAAAGGPAGWQCTTPGTAGSNAVWKAMGNLAN